jgi:choline dehydrogenase-like flavoprotein
VESPALKAFLSRRQQVQSFCDAWRNAPDAFVDDVDNPYVTPADRPFVWLRSRQLGGRMAVPAHGRQYYRLASADFYPDDGLSPAWPFKPGELDPWYELVERRVALSGTHDNLTRLPDGRLTRALGYSEAEQVLRQSIVSRWPGAKPTSSKRLQGPGDF